MRILDLDILKKGVPGISPVYAGFLAEAAIVCLERMGHSPGAIIHVVGDFEENFAIHWPQNERLEDASTWGDSREAVEYGATALAMLLILELTPFDFFERNEQGGKFDYTLKKIQDIKMDGPSTLNAALEVSGIFAETPKNTIEARLRSKTIQAKEEKDANLSAYIVVIEFKQPKSKIIKI